MTRERDASIPLLTEVMRNPLDPGYRAAAARKKRLLAEGKSPRSRRGNVTVMVLLSIVLWVVITWAVITLRAPQVENSARTVLIDQITERSAELDSLVTRNADLAAEVDQLQGAALAGADRPLLDQLAADQLTTGTSAATGSGLRVTLTDADPVDPESTVRDTDLQTVVNGLWAAGAEAIAVNGQRLGPTTAIRTAGDAILVDVVPLVGPYTVEAIGDPQGMQTALARNTGGQLLAVLHSTYGIRTQVTSQNQLHLPAVAVPTLRSAQLPAGVGVVGTTQ